MYFAARVWGRARGTRERTIGREAGEHVALGHADTMDRDARLLAMIVS